MMITAIRHPLCILSLRHGVVAGLVLAFFAGCGQAASNPTTTDGNTTTSSVMTSPTPPGTTSPTNSSQVPGVTPPTSGDGVTSTPLATSTDVGQSTSGTTGTGLPEPASSSAMDSMATDEQSSSSASPQPASMSDDFDSSSASGNDTASEDTSGEAGFNPCPTVGPCVIMPYGDSITEGFPIWGGYRIELFSKARAAGHDLTFVGSVANGPQTVGGAAFPRNHEGHGGFTIKDEPARNANGIFRFARPSLQTYKPHIVTLMVGTNDINGNIDTANAPARLGELLDEIYSVAPDVLVVLAQIVPSRTDGTNQAIRNYNAALPGLVATQTARGRHLILVDMYAAFTENPNYKQAWLGDNLHPNEAGYARMAEVWYAVIEPFLR